MLLSFRVHSVQVLGCASDWVGGITSIEKITENKVGGKKKNNHDARSAVMTFVSRQQPPFGGKRFDLTTHSNKIIAPPQGV